MSKSKRQNADRNTHKKPTDVVHLNTVIHPEREGGPTDNPTAEANNEQDPPVPSRLWEWIKRDSTFTNWCIVVFTGVLAAVSIYQFVVIRGQLAEMRRDQRPWIRMEIDFATIKPLDANIGTLSMINIGKTPAKSINGQIAVQIVKNGEEPQLNSSRAGESLSAGAVFPNAQPINLPVIRMSFPFEDIAFQGPMEDIPTRVSPISQAEFNEFINARTFFVVYGVINYSDFSGVAHWTKFCGFKGYQPGSTSTARKCADYNDADDN